MKRIAVLLFLTFLGSAPLCAMPSQITFQGTLKQKGVPVNTTKNMQFSFVDEAGSTIPGTTPITIANVQVTNGLFAVQLPIDPSLPWEQYVPYIRVSVEGQNLSPDQPVNANLYAVAAIPQGMIAMFANSCPVGWTVFAGLQGRFPIGADGDTFPIGTTGGNLTHTHTTPNHQHSLATITQNINASCGAAPVGITSNQTQLLALSAGSTCGYNGVQNFTTVSGGGVTGSASSLPPYQAVVFCQKL